MFKAVRTLSGMKYYYEPLSAVNHVAHLTGGDQ
jgi:hypothetical protein